MTDNRDVTESVIPQPGMWFEHALDWEKDPQLDRRPARYVISDIADHGETALLQVLYKRIDATSQQRPHTIDADLFSDIVLRWLTAEESARATRQAQFRQVGNAEGPGRGDID